MENVRNFIEFVNADYSTEILVLFLFLLVLDWAFEIKGEFTVFCNCFMALVTLLMAVLGFVDRTFWFFALVGFVHLIIKLRKKE